MQLCDSARIRASGFETPNEYLIEYFGRKKTLRAHLHHHGRYPKSCWCARANFAPLSNKSLKAQNCFNEREIILKSGGASVLYILEMPSSMKNFYTQKIIRHRWSWLRGGKSIFAEMGSERDWSRRQLCTRLALSKTDCMRLSRAWIKIPA
jgi:hypothetical protein